MDSASTRLDHHAQDQGGHVRGLPPILATQGVPGGDACAYECFSEDSNEVVGIRPGTQFESRERYRVSEVEAERREAMAPFVEAESSGLYMGRELETRSSGDCHRR